MTFKRYPVAGVRIKEKPQVDTIPESIWLQEAD
jgi:hypothetical protein